MTTTAINRALVSVSDKTGLVEFATALHKLGVELISTGGTADTLAQAGLPVKDVSSVTGFPEILDGRVKTLHPLVHGGILARRDLATHQAQLAEHHITPIDMVVVNLYPFTQTVAQDGVTFAAAIEKIDVGGPTMVRAAAKNFKDVAIVTDATDYPALVNEIKETGGLSLGTRYGLAKKAFAQTAAYDTAISEFLENRSSLEAETEQFAVAAADTFPAQTSLRLVRKQALRYGENPHQEAALYVPAGPSAGQGVADAMQLQGKELSYNNLIDLDAAWNLVCEFDDAACAIIKHTNPCGVGVSAVPLEAFRLALATDPVSAFGGIIAFNRRVDAGTATEITSMFVEAVIAPDFDEASLHVFATKKNLRLMRISDQGGATGAAIRSISGGILMQSNDSLRMTADQLKVVTKRQPTEQELKDLLFAWKICKHVKSNAIVYAREGQLVGAGAGQMSRVDSVKFGAQKAVLPLAGCVLASDAFFPFRDGLDEAAKHRITAVIQPGGSVRDEEVIAAADEHGLAMVLTGVRHFRH
ncbi:MAG: bifunctional phosphoribosylaminoimidazolecarboxamide formyltransferase/IMP cyclohydrolase [Blastocatellia bacterium]|nr:bifunctional phosphoribosylaminoimidazolecarboxamide formyltransferase/IMP cyclohydrolase [Blastocatellia bacterium]